MRGHADPTETARRNLALRIERFLALLEKDGRQPVDAEGRAALQAIDNLAAGRFPEGEDAMMFAEKNWDSARITVVGVRPTLNELRERLAKVQA